MEVGIRTRNTGFSLSPFLIHSLSLFFFSNPSFSAFLTYCLSHYSPFLPYFIHSFFPRFLLDSRSPSCPLPLSLPLSFPNILFPFLPLTLPPTLPSSLPPCLPLFLPSSLLPWHILYHRDGFIQRSCLLLTTHSRIQTRAGEHNLRVSC